jgi:hypothetical protein
MGGMTDASITRRPPTPNTRLARHLDDLRRLVETLSRRGRRIAFVKECLSFTGEDLPMANLLLSVMGRSRSLSSLDRRAEVRRNPLNAVDGSVTTQTANLAR